MSESGHEKTPVFTGAFAFWGKLNCGESGIRTRGRSYPTTTV